MTNLTNNNLFAAEEWEVIFNAFRSVSIKAFDYDTVYKALDNYITVNNPEEYDRIKKDGVMSIHLDLISRLAHNLSYRYEQGARENFFDTATLRESVIKLAKAFSYKPKRNRAANGLCRVSGVRTTEPLLDSDGNDISNQTIRWNQSGDSNWQNKFTKILNKSFISTNPFGRPLKRESIYNVQNEIYSINRLNNTQAVYPFNSPINGRRVNFEAVSTEIDSNGLVIEESPDMMGNFKLLYKNDRNGNFSPNTGFFIQFKEGSLQYTNFQFNDALSDRTVDIDQRNINETDVWVFEIIDDIQSSEWKSVNSLYGQMIDYERIFNKNMELYEIETRADNMISINFGDGLSTKIPKGLYRVWYRTSSNESFNIKEREIFEAPIQIPYVGDDGQRYQLTLFITNLSEISNAEPEESIYQIKRNAPLSQYTQDRMINAEDYNVYPQTRTSLIKKQKTVNRTHPGHSRYMDIYDESGEISYVTINYEDAFIYSEGKTLPYELDVMFTTNYTTEIYNMVSNITENDAFKNHMYQYIVTSPVEVDDEIVWDVIPNNVSGRMGCFKINNTVIAVGSTSSIDSLRYIQDGTILEFEDAYGNKIKTFVADIRNNGIINPSIDTVGNITLSESIPTNSKLINVLPTLRYTLSEYESEIFAELMEDELDFDIFYNFIDDSYSTTSSGLNILVAEVIFEEDDDLYGKYIFNTPSLDFMIGSNNDVRFFVKPTSNIIDPETLLPINDTVTVSDGNIDYSTIKHQFLKRTNKSDDIIYF